MFRDPLDVVTTLFALLAIVLLWKVRSVLGTRTGAERPPFNPFSKAPAAARTDNVVALPGPGNMRRRAEADPERWKDIAEPRANEGLDAIAAADAAFSGAGFLEGAKAAYEMIVNAFAAGDRKALRDLLAKDVFDSFAGAIADRESRGEVVSSTFVSIDRAMIDEAQLKGPQAQITVRFLSKLITATRNKAGLVVEGNADKVVDMVDVWTFARETKARDPNWRLVATETGH